MPLRILITAGPTREMFDPVRYLSNRSTGEMGYAIAAAARSRGHRVTLVSGPTALPPPKNVRYVAVESVRDLQRACLRYFKKCDVLIMTAAVCDYTPANFSRQKIRRSKMKKILLKQTPDIVASLAKRKGNRRVIGFCLETKDWLENARRKVKRKHLDGIVANYLSTDHNPFGKSAVRTAFLSRDSVRVLPKMPKKRIAGYVVRWAENERLP